MSRAILAVEQSAGLFDTLSPEPADGLLALIGMHAADQRPGKIDLGVGVFRDAAGATPVLAAVKAAEARLLADEASKSYLGAEGDRRFVELLGPILFGAPPPAKVRGVQTPGGTGALRLAFDLIARSNPGATVWVGTPTWANHLPIIAAAGLAYRTHPYFDRQRGKIDRAAMLAGLKGLGRGDVLLLHGCCHNPTGADLMMDDWRAVGEILAERGALPLVDLAYQGLGEGLSADTEGARHLVDALPEAIVAYSCDKNFGLYRERVGGLWIKASSTRAADLAMGKMLALARDLWSMPPSHGASVVRCILDDPALDALWRHELAAMRDRLNALRRALAQVHPRLEPLGEQRGLFATLPLSAEDVARLREDHAIYMSQAARINVAGLNDRTIARFAEVITPLLDRVQTGHPA